MTKQITFLPTPNLPESFRRLMLRVDHHHILRLHRNPQLHTLTSNLFCITMSRRSHSASPSPDSRPTKRARLDSEEGSARGLTPDDYRDGVMLAPMVRSGACECCFLGELWWSGVRVDLSPSVRWNEEPERESERVWATPERCCPRDVGCGI
jgi:hypothetical protein